MQTSSTAKQTDKAGVTLLLYGESGAGKTTALGTLPNDKTLIIDIDGGLSVLRHRDIESVRITESLDNLKDTFDEISSSPNALGFKCVCLDNASELEKFMLIHLAKDNSSGMPTLNDYGVVGFKMRDYCRRLRDLREKGVNVVITAWEMPLELEQSDGEVRTRLYPMVGRKFAPELCGMFDIVARLEIVEDTKSATGETKRIMRLDCTEKIVAKNRFGDPKRCGPDLGKLFEYVKRQPAKEAAPAKQEPATQPATTQAAATKTAPATTATRGRPATTTTK